MKKVKIALADERYTPECTLLKACIEEAAPGHGRKIAFNNRHAAVVGTGVTVEDIPAGYVMRFSLVERLANKGMVLTTTAFCGTGTINLALVNCGREIVNVIDGETVAHVWMEKSESFRWSF